MHLPYFHTKDRLLPAGDKNLAPGPISQNPSLFPGTPVPFPLESTISPLPTLNILIRIVLPDHLHPASHLPLAWTPALHTSTHVVTSVWQILSLSAPTTTSTFFTNSTVQSLEIPVRWRLTQTSKVTSSASPPASQPLSRDPEPAVHLELHGPSPGQGCSLCF